MFSLKNVKMKPKLISLFLIAGIVPIVIAGFYSNFKAQKSLTHQTHNQLKSVRDIKKNQIEYFFHQRRADMGAMIKNIEKMGSELTKPTLR